MDKITPNLWFDTQAEEAANYYCSIFKNSRILQTMYYNKEVAAVSGLPEGSVMTVSFEIDGQSFIGINGGPMFKFSEAVSFMVSCKDQAEIDYLWDKLVQGGEEQPCGWLKDKYGLSWQIVPAELDAMMDSGDVDKSGRVMKALLEMKKIDFPALKRAYDVA